MLPRIFTLVAIFGIAGSLNADQPESKSPRQALKPFGDLIGVWKGVGQPSGTLQEKQKGFWSEKMIWQWQFKDKDAWFKVDFEKSKYFSTGEMRYVPQKDHYTLVLTTVKKEKISYVGNFQTRDDTKILTFERDADKESHRLVFTLLHDNYIRYRFEARPEGKALFSTKWSVGAKLDGVEFAGGSGKPECVVSGGTATTAVNFMGKTYYVCCSGCKDEFNATPAKYVKEYEEKQAAKKKK